MDMIMESLGGVLPFLMYFVPAIALVYGFVWVYMQVTPHDEVALIKENNTAASIAYSGTAIGFAIPVASAVAHSANLPDFIVWGLVAGIAQLATFLIFRQFYPRISERIQAGEMAVPVKLATWSIIVGLLNAAAMSW